MQCLSPGQAGEDRHVDGGDGEDQAEDAAPQRHRDGDRQYQQGEGEQRIHEPHHQVVPPTSGDAGRGAERHTGEDGQADGEAGHDQRDTAPVDDAAEHVAPQLVGSEEVPRRPRWFEQAGGVDLQRFAGGDEGGRNRQEDHERGDHGADPPCWSGQEPPEKEPEPALVAARCGCR